MTHYPVAMSKDGDAENIRVRIEGELKDRWRKMLDERGISQQRAVVALLDFMVNVDPLTQLMVFDQVGERDIDALEEIVLKRLAERKAARAAKAAVKKKA